jgi:hypothetical protein
MVFLLTSKCFGQYIRDPFNPDPKGPDKTIVKNQITSENVYQYTFGKSKVKDSTLVFTEKFFYDTNGMMIREEPNMVLSNSSSKLKARKFKYYSNGFLAGITEVYDYRNYGRKTDSLIYEFKYDKNGNQTYLVYHNKDTTNVFVKHKIYNDHEQLISVENKINNFDPYKERELTYNENGDICGVRHFGIKGDLLYSYVISYDYPQQKQFVYVEKEGKANELYQEVTYNNKKAIRYSGFYS